MAEQYLFGWMDARLWSFVNRYQHFAPTRLILLANKVFLVQVISCLPPHEEEIAEKW